MPLSGATPSGGDDLASTDEVKVYKDEGDDENRENLSEDKLGLVTETEEGKTSDGEGSHFLGDGKQQHETAFLGSTLDYPIGNHLPFGYPLVSPYSYSYGSLGLGGLSLTAGGFPFYMYGNDLFPHPPSAHLCLPVPWHLSSHAGLPSHQSSMYGFIPSASAAKQTPSVYGIHTAQTPPPLYGFPSPYRQFPHQFCHSKLPNAIGWGSPTVSLSSHYASYQLPRFTCRGSLSPSPPASVPPTSAGISPYPGILCPSAIRTTETEQTRATISFSSQQRHILSSRTCSSKTFSNASRHLDIPSSAKSFSSFARKVPHIKKPLNAFMIFMKEMRQKVIDECTLKESAAINQILGRKWHSLDRAEQGKYYEMARKEKELHRQLYPMWSARDNYALHSQKKRRRDRLPDDDKAIDADEDRECQNAKKCRARFGLDKQSYWCKPCRRKKRCIRFMQESETNLMDGEAVEWVEERPDEGLPADSTTELFSPTSSSLSFVLDESRMQVHMNKKRQSSASSVGSGSSAMSCDDEVPAQVLSQSMQDLQLTGQETRFNVPSVESDLVDIRPALSMIV